jgi:hypothetical protein
VSQSCSSMCQTFISRPPKWAVILYITFLILSNIIQNVWNLFPANLLCVCLFRHRTMGDPSNNSFISIQFGLFTIIIHKLNSPEKISAQFVQISESDFLTLMHQLGPILISLALDDARRGSLKRTP